ncbi:DUF982 domain-containing protein [Aminobacter sp. SR38]|nr:DUF982 domain-containing protein [Aminobacter sp. SR38]
MDKEFNPPVVIARENRAGRRTIASAWEALEWLRLRRPACTGPRYRSAVRICRDAAMTWPRLLQQEGELSGFVGQRDFYPARGCPVACAHKLPNVVAWRRCRRVCRLPDHHPRIGSLRNSRRRRCALLGAIDPPRALGARMTYCRNIDGC